MRVIIIDDEQDAVKSLSIILKEYCENVELIGSANSVIEGIKLINKTAPDLVFLDVEMPDGSGFDLLEATVDKINYQTVFTTAYSNYAIDAFKANATGYLMKPICIDELLRVVEGIKKSLGVNQKNKNKELLTSLREKEGRLTKIPISLKNEYLFIDLEDIQFIKSEGSYSQINTSDKKYLTTKNLKHYEILLSGSNFMRISKSYIVNIEKVVRYLREDGGILVLKNKAEIAVSRNRKEDLRNLLGI